MTLKEQDTFYVELAIQQTAYFLAVCPEKSADFIAAELFKNTCNKFREHNRRLSSLQVLEVADLEFIIRANGHAEGVLLIQQKKIQS